MYFVNPDLVNEYSYNWMRNNLNYIYKEGSHEFYKWNELLNNLEGLRTRIMRIIYSSNNYSIFN